MTRKQYNLGIHKIFVSKGSLRVGGDFLAHWFPGNKKIYLPKPSWGNHTPIFKHAGLEVGSYGYYDPKTCGLDFAAACADISVSI